MNVLRRTALHLGLPALLLGLWWLLSAGSTSFYLPPLSDIMRTFVEVWFSTRLIEDVLPSLGRLGVGYGLAVAIGVALGVMIGQSRTLRAVVEPVLEFGRAIPPPVLVPVFILFAGAGHTMKVLVIVSGCVWPVLLNTVAGVRNVDDVLADTARIYGITGAGRLRHLVLRAASPQIITGMRQALSIAIILMVISEMFASSEGLGFTIIGFQRTFAIPEMWSGIILLGLLGCALSLMFHVVENRVLSWYLGLRQTQRAG
jgi:ABC-type nitrate/sulfonate/bicarbonate transport system permease component